MITPSSHLGPAGTPEAFEAFYASLAERRARDFKAMHVLAARGILTSMDFDVWTDIHYPEGRYAKREYPCRGSILGAGGDFLVNLCNLDLAAYQPDEFLAVRERWLWREFWDAPFIGMKPVDMEHAARGRAFFILRGVL